MAQETEQERLDKEKRIREERRYIEVRKAAVVVAEWENADEPTVKAAREKLEALQQEEVDLKERLRQMNDLKNAAQQEYLQTLEPFLPEPLRKPEKP